MKLLVLFLTVFIAVDATMAADYSAAVDVFIRSEGCNDPAKLQGGCGHAYIKVNGKDYSLHKRGHNVVVVDGQTGAILGTRAFDTYGVSNAGQQLKEYLNSLSGDKLVLVAIQDEGSKYATPAYPALKRLGAQEPFLRDFRHSYALVGYAGSEKPSWVHQEQKSGGKGPSVISMKVPLNQEAIQYFLVEPGQSCDSYCAHHSTKCVEQGGFPGGDAKELFAKLGFPCKSEQPYTYTDNPCIAPGNGHCYGTTKIPDKINCADGHNGSVRRLCPCI